MMYDYTQDLKGRFTEKSLPIPEMPQYQCIGVRADVDTAGRPITVPYWSAEIPVGPTDQPVLAVRRGILAVGTGTDDGFGNPVPADMVVLVTRAEHTYMTVVYEPVVDIALPPTTTDAQGNVIPTMVDAGTVLAKAPANGLLRISAAMVPPADTWDYSIQLGRESYYTLFPTDLLWSRDPEYRHG